MKLCINKKMMALKEFIFDYRFKKFEDRKWTITKRSNFQPICYSNQFTQSFPRNKEDIAIISKAFY